MTPYQVLERKLGLDIPAPTGLRKRAPGARGKLSRWSASTTRHGQGNGFITGPHQSLANQRGRATSLYKAVTCCSLFPLSTQRQVAPTLHRPRREQLTGSELPPNSSQPGNDRCPAQFQGSSGSRRAPSGRVNSAALWNRRNRRLGSSQSAKLARRSLQRTGKPESREVNSPASILAGRGEKNGVAPGSQNFRRPHPEPQPGEP